jgi:hypothetical protein
LDAVTAVVSLSVGAVTRQPGFRTSAQSWLASRREEASTVAGIAELLSGQDGQELTSIARNSFHHELADMLRRDDMADITPNPALHR